MQREHLDALIESYLYTIDRIPQTVIEDGVRIFGSMSEPALRMKAEVKRLCEVQSEEGITPYLERAAL